MGKKKVVKAKTTRMSKEDKSYIARKAWVTWEEIAYEVSKMCHEYGEKLTNTAARDVILEQMDFRGYLEEMDKKYSYKQIDNVMKSQKFV